MSAQTELPRFACPDWWERIQAGEMPMADIPVNEKKAAKAVAFFDRLRLPDVPGTPLLKDACGEWFRQIVRVFIASEDPESGQRLVWELLTLVPKKNSKTTYVAALGLTALFMEEAPNRQMLIVAPSQNISERCFDQAQGMIRLDEKLVAIFQVQDHLKCITRRKTGTKLDVKSFDTTIVTGEIPVLTIIDEVHELGKKAKAQAVMQQIRGGGITKQGGQVLMITTQSDEPPAGIWKSELEKARKIRDGKGGKSPILLPVLYEFPLELQRDPAFWRDSRHWHLILPNNDRSIDPARLLADYENNGRVSTQAEQIWASQHLNIEIGVGLGDDSWPGAPYWPGAGDDSLTLEALIERSEVAVVGIDGGGLDDLLGVGVIGRDRITREWLHWGHAWAQTDVLDLRKEIAPRLRDFERCGELTICAHATQDIAEVADVVEQLRDAGLLPAAGAIGLDPMGVTAMIDEIASRGIAEEQMVAVSQGYRLSGAVWGVERKLKDGTFWHGAQTLMSWSVGNAKVEQRGNAVLITKQMAGKAKIDPLIALFNAAHLMSRNPEGVGSSVYRSRGALVL
jgi:phage terminase large subunit-like protein